MVIGKTKDIAGSKSNKGSDLLSLVFIQKDQHSNKSTAITVSLFGILDIQGRKKMRYHPGSKWCNACKIKYLQKCQRLWYGNNKVKEGASYHSHLTMFSSPNCNFSLWRRVIWRTFWNKKGEKNYLSCTNRKPKSAPSWKHSWM